MSFDFMSEFLHNISQFVKNCFKSIYKFFHKPKPKEVVIISPDPNIIIHSEHRTYSIYTYKYFNYDKAGNWLKSIEYKNDNPTSFREREIEYY